MDKKPENYGAAMKRITMLENQVQYLITERQKDAAKINKLTAEKAMIEDKYFELDSIVGNAEFTCGKKLPDIIYDYLKLLSRDKTKNGSEK